MSLTQLSLSNNNKKCGASLTRFIIWTGGWLVTSDERDERTLGRFIERAEEKVSKESGPSARRTRTSPEGRRIVLYSVYAVYCIVRLYTLVLYSDRPVGQGTSAV